MLYEVITPFLRRQFVRANLRADVVAKDFGSGSGERPEARILEHAQIVGHRHAERARTLTDLKRRRITSYNVCYTKLLRSSAVQRGKLG